MTNQENDIQAENNVLHEDGNNQLKNNNLSESLDPVPADRAVSQANAKPVPSVSDEKYSTRLEVGGASEDTSKEAPLPSMTQAIPLPSAQTIPNSTMANPSFVSDQSVSSEVGKVESATVEATVPSEIRQGLDNPSRTPQNPDQSGLASVPSSPYPVANSAYTPTGGNFAPIDNNYASTDNGYVPAGSSDIPTANNYAPTPTPASPVFDTSYAPLPENRTYPDPNQMPGMANPPAPTEGATFPTGEEKKNKRGLRKGPGWIGTIAIALAVGVTAWSVPPLTSLINQGETKAVTAPVVQADPVHTNWEAVAKNVAASVVSIQVTSAQSGDSGSGVIFDEAGHVLTNYHVISAAIEGQAKVQIAMSDGKIYPAKVLGGDSSTDLAVLEFVHKPEKLQMATLGSSDNLSVAAPVAAIGSPLGLDNTVTTGIISALDRPVTVQQSSGDNNANPFSQNSGGELVVTNAIQVDAAINPGNSGGPLFNAEGEVIGITSSIASTSGGNSSSGQAGSIGIGFAIPVNLAKSVAQEILKNGKVVHARLGVVISSAQAEVDGGYLQGAVVSEVASGSAAEEAGLQKGDLILQIDKHRVSSSSALTGYVRWYRPGDKVKITYIREGKTQEVQVTLGSDQSSEKSRG